MCSLNRWNKISFGCDSIVTSWEVFFCYVCSSSIFFWLFKVENSTRWVHCSSFNPQTIKWSTIFMLFFSFLVRSFAVPVSVDLSLAFIIRAKLPQNYLRYSPPSFLHPFCALFFFSPSSGPFDRQFFCSTTEKKTSIYAFTLYYF